MLQLLKLKHIDDLLTEQPNYAELMTTILNYKNTWFQKRYMFVREFKRIYQLIHELKEVDFNNLSWKDSKSPIKKPSNIDSISFKAMMSVQALGKQAEYMSQAELISETIARCCHRENRQSPFEVDSASYRRFKEQILNQPLLDMIALYRELDKDLKASFLKWEKLFMSVQVLDEDYERAGGSRMNQFNVLTSLKQICADFNVTLDEAWQVSYGTVQTNAYSKATRAHIQDEMRQLKEIEYARRRREQT